MTTSLKKLVVLGLVVLASGSIVIGCNKTTAQVSPDAAPMSQPPALTAPVNDLPVNDEPAYEEPVDEQSVYDDDTIVYDEEY
jgi:hypothetical protein